MAAYEYRTATLEDCSQLAQAAREIWEEHYTPLIGKTQVNYMVERYQSEPVLRKAIAEENYRYFLVYDGEELVGYCGVQPRGDELFLSKLYVKKAYRRQGISRKLLDLALEYAKELNSSAVRLTVNKDNQGSIAAYHAMGFETIDAVVTDIGNGFVMDDYILRLAI